MSRPRAIAVSIGVLALLLALTPFVPRGDDDEDGALQPSGDRAPAARLLPANAVGSSRVTPAMQSEIDRVVAAGRSSGRAVGRAASPAALARSASQLVRCAELDGQRYCLGLGWTDDSQSDVRSRMTAATQQSARVKPRERTGDLDAVAALARTARMTPNARAKAERTELELAARSVAKVWLLRHEIQGVKLPSDFLTRHPEARASAPTAASARTATASATPSANPNSAPRPTTTPSAKASATPTTQARPKRFSDYPSRVKILSRTQVSAQSLTYWCGPTSMQMIAWGWSGKVRSQQHWANQLGTSRSGTAITDMVRVINRDTGWDNAKHAGKYVTLDIGDWTFNQWMMLMMRHISDYKAPVVLHPILSKRYYPYLDDDASGHYQVGRGYDKNGTKPTLLGYFEPWNQQRFDPSEPRIARVQWRSAYRSYRANQAHFLHNVGV